MDKVILEMAQTLCENKEDNKTVETYRKALDIIHAFVIIVSMDKKLIFMNSRICKITGISAADYKDASCETLRIAERRGDECAFNRLANGESLTYFTRNNEEYECEASYIYNNLGEKIGFIEYILPRNKDVSKADREIELVTKSRYDDLTRLFRRDFFYDRTRWLLDHNPGVSYLMVYWNVKRFRVINDVFSTKTGNMVLINIGEKIKKLIDREGTAARLSDDKFVFCLPKNKLTEEWLRDNATITLISDTAAFTFKSTFGIYEIQDRTVSLDIMCDRAKMAQSSVAEFHLANNKPYARYDKILRKHMMEEQYLLSQMSYALQEEQFKIYFQPVYDIKTKKIVSSEALVRWLHPEKGLIHPDKFIGIFEKNGLITQLDRYIWDKVGAILEKRLKSKKPCVPVSVNVSRVDFFTTTLLDDLAAIIAKHNLPKNMLRVEVTESAYVDDPGRILTIVRELRVRGFTVLLDDFGSGYSSLNTLKDMPLDVLKIDMKFLCDFASSQRAGLILESIITMARRLNMEVIAEGVENDEQADFLLKVGCSKVQGFLYAKPMPEEEFMSKLDAQSQKGK